MNSFIRTDEFDGWLSRLRDRIGKARILQRLDAAQHGNFGDCAPVGAGVSEMRIHSGPGYRIYFTRRGEVIYLLLLGGTSRPRPVTSRAPKPWRKVWKRSEYEQAGPI